MNPRETQAEQAGRKEKIKLQRSEAEPATRSELSKKKKHAQQESNKLSTEYWLQSNSRAFAIM
jgi:hypothetical protein